MAGVASVALAAQVAGPSSVEVTNLLRVQSGEGRFRWLHARRGREKDIRDACEQFADVAWVVTREQVVDEMWFGPRVSTDALRRMGDVAQIGRAHV